MIKHFLTWLARPIVLRIVILLALVLLLSLTKRSEYWMGSTEIVTRVSKSINVIKTGGLTVSIPGSGLKRSLQRINYTAISLLKKNNIESCSISEMLINDKLDYFFARFTEASYPIIYDKDSEYILLLRKELSEKYEVIDRERILVLARRLDVD